MVRTLKSFSLTFIIIGCQVKSIFAHRNMTEKNGIKDSHFIELTNFQRPILIHQREIDPDEFGLCYQINTTTSINPSTFKGLEKSMTCNGWLDNCLAFDEYSRNDDKPGPTYCYSDDGRIIWAEDANFFTYGDKNTQEKCTEKETPPKQIEENGALGFICMCRCTEWPMEDETQNWAFSLEPQESDVSRNKIVVGVRLRRYDKMIYLEIKEGKIGSGRGGRWRTSHEKYHSIRNVDYSPLKADSRSVKLDKIFVPPSYVVTGVKFSVARTTLVDGQNQILRLEVQGTKFNKVTKKLIKSTSRWYDHENSARRYTRHRHNSSEPSTVKENEYIVFQHNDLHSYNLGYHTFPYLRTANVATKKNRFLRGIGLSYIDQGIEGGYILPEIFRRKPQWGLKG